jgi:ubiquinone/menaquinone biosynthesis C-methylase UbiE
MRPGVGMVTPAVGAFGSAISISIYAITISPHKEGCAPMERPTDPAKLKAQIAYNSASYHFDDEPLAFWARIGSRTVERLALPTGARVLDVGCGTGASAIPAATAVGPTGLVIGADLANRLLDRAREKARQQGLFNVEFRQGDMEDLGYRDGSFDAVVSVFSVFFVPDLTKQVAELWRMVKPSGQLAITTWGPRAFEPAATAFWAAVKEHTPPALHFGGFNPWDRVTTVEALRDLLIGADVPDPEVEAEASQQPLRTVDDWWTIVIGSGFVWTVEQMGAEAAKRVREDNLNSLRARAITFVETNVIYAAARKASA